MKCAAICIASILAAVPMSGQKLTPVKVFVTSNGASNGFTDPSKDNRDTVKDLKDAIKDRDNLALAEGEDDAPRRGILKGLSARRGCDAPESAARLLELRGVVCRGC
jgi:hypothetical protein